MGLEIPDLLEEAADEDSREIPRLTATCRL
jgi:hypothetical protein